MDKNKLELFFNRMSRAVLEAGLLAKEKQGKVKNVGKTAEKMPGDTGRQARDRGAKTIIDEQVQEILLKVAGEVLDPKTIYLDAEEDTSSVKLFKQRFNDDISTSLVIDPIDGTVEYIAGGDSYSVCVGLVGKEKMWISIAYFPARDDYYFLAPNGKSYLAKNASKKAIKTAKLIKAKKSEKKIIYKNNRVPEKVIKTLEEKGYVVLDDTYKNIGAADCLIACMEGKVVAYLSHTRQMRDILLGPILAGAGGYALDWEGNKLIWPKSGRVVRAIFGVGGPPEGILKCLV